ncbi:acyl-CoA dehydrogenase family protein [Henriciella marina]|uniref:acyl-CoA dehydrogenase family protein n=1 Tax=Henriciella marina TaxID=453851 RepID=UPI00035FEE5A|nr:acyl-CoA dehydrogenase family protein [Henriciella marina]
MAADSNHAQISGQENLAEKARGLQTVLGERADEAEVGRKLPQDLADELSRSGFYAMCNPLVDGGAAVSPVDYAAAIEALAQGDAAPAWCSFIATTAALGMAFSESESVRQLLNAPGVITAGVFAPMGRAVEAEQDGVRGYRVNGRWAWGSGSQNADWVSGGCFLANKDGELVMSDKGGPIQLAPIFAADQLHFIDTWHVTGLKGTGSTDFEVRDAFVPADRVTRGFGRTRQDEAIFRFPAFGLLAIGIASVALGAARGALEDFYDLAGAKKPSGSRKTLAEKALTHRDVALAEADIRQGRAFFYEAIEAAWAAALEGPVSIDTRRDLRLATTSAVQSAKRAVDRIYELAGGTAVYSQSPIQRRFRDVHVATQHIMVGASTWETTGRLFLGQPADTAML